MGALVLLCFSSRMLDLKFEPLVGYYLLHWLQILACSLSKWFPFSIWGIICSLLAKWVQVGWTLNIILFHSTHLSLGILFPFILFILFLVMVCQHSDSPSVFQFFMQAKAICPSDPLVYNELGVVAYNMKE